MSDPSTDLPLFHGPHIPRIFFECALDRLDLRAAVAAAPEPWRAAVEALADVLDHAGSDARAFAWHLLDAGGRRYVGQSVGVIEARKRLPQISPAAFRRYLARV